MNLTRTLTALGASAALVLGTTACGGGDDGGGGGGGNQSAGKLDGVTLKVGSKDFVEQQVLGELTKQTLEAAGADVSYEQQQGTEPARKAMLTGQTDLYWDYTGTGWITFLENDDPIPDTQKQYEATKKEDLAKNDVEWITPAPFNNTYALAIRAQKAQELGVKTISDYAKLANDNPDEATMCVESEFNSRNDGLEGLEKKYGFKVASNRKRVLDTGLVYTQTARGEQCNFGEVFTTDGRIKSLNLTVLEDDKKFFPVYQGAVTLKKETLQKTPAIQEVLKPLADALTQEQVTTMNAAVDSEGRQPAAVAKEFLEEQGIVN